eukprot:279487_1
MVAQSEVLLTAKQAFVVSQDKMEIRDREIMKPNGTEVIVKILRSAVCHSDVHSFEKSSVWSRVPFPQAPGHEIFGEVHTFGPEATTTTPLQVGAQVVVYPWIGCDSCGACTRGDFQMCASPTRVLRYVGGASLQGATAQGGFAEYVTLPHPKFLVSADGVDPDLAVVMPCCGITSLNAIRTSQLESVEPEGVLVVIGTGGLGIMGIQWAKQISKQTIVAVDMSDKALEAAKKFGAHFAFNPSTTANIPSAIAALPIKNTRISAVVDFVGNMATNKLVQALGAVNAGTHLVVVGIHGAKVEMNLTMFTLRGMRMSGIFVGPLALLTEAMDRARAGDIQSPVTLTRPFSEVQEALEDLKHGRVVGRQVLVMGESGKSSL